MHSYCCRRENHDKSMNDIMVSILFVMVTVGSMVLWAVLMEPINDCSLYMKVVEDIFGGSLRCLLCMPDTLQMNCAIKATRSIGSKRVKVFSHKEPYEKFFE